MTNRPSRWQEEADELRREAFRIEEGSVAAE